MVPSFEYLETVLVTFAKKMLFLKTVGAHHREGPVLSALPLLLTPNRVTEWTPREWTMHGREDLKQDGETINLIRPVA